jgi:beta-glucanase (GH16 family)
MRRHPLDLVRATAATASPQARPATDSVHVIHPSIPPRAHRSRGRLHAVRRSLLTLAILAPAAVFAANASAAQLPLAPLTPLERTMLERADLAQTQSPKEIIVTRPVSSTGFYAVRVTISGGAKADPLRVAVSRAPAMALTLRHHAVVWKHVWSHGSAIVVRVKRTYARWLHLRISVRRIASPIVLLREHVAPGVYNVKVVVSAKSTSADKVSLQIGAGQPQSVSAHHHAPATVSEHVTVAGSVLSIRASGNLTRPRVKVRLAKLRLTPAPAAAPAPVPPAAAPSATTTPVPTGVAGNWHLIFDDEFNGSSLNPQYWSTGWFGSGITGGITGASEPECYDPSHVVEANGELDLNFTQETESCDGDSHPYTSAMVTTNGKFSFTYGLIEFRVWLPTTSNGQVADWPDIWTDGQSWPADGEIDVAEGLGGNICGHYHGPSYNGAGTGEGGITGCPQGTYTGGWHTFAADWEPGIVTWYYDGKDIGCLETSGSACGATNTTIAGAPMYIILSLGSSYSLPITAPTSLRVDYVRVWQH